ncbi:restriction endonuclease [Domibacillus mangrovi]|uniref:Restriction endonuclease type IV Mrr domain-containing protein n=1 Tax=Domibacillus mangrovi TaxID=1714354 RepID=A0A1Q5P265_9BACI|nr:restriction endonuclease [Domibacillus mangrovi]OKL36345.1 hypothetical protein BLL40_10645 [Domibacillus mangrovi]
MKKRKKKSLYEEFSLFLLFLIAASVYFQTNSLESVFTAVITAGAILLLIPLLITYRRKQKLLRAGIADVDQMDGLQFEAYLQQLFKALGYTVTLTPPSGDYGADLILKKQGETIAVQAKRYKSNVGIKAVQEVKAAEMHYNASASWVVTNSYFTDAAVNLAKSNRVTLVNRDELIRLILNSQKKSA